MTRLDAADRHLLAIAAVWVVLVVVGLPLGALVLGLSLRVFLVVSGVGS
jgi:hypothetical protein